MLPRDLDDFILRRLLSACAPPCTVNAQTAAHMCCNLPDRVRRNRPFPVLQLLLNQSVARYSKNFGFRSPTEGTGSFGT